MRSHVDIAIEYHLFVVAYCILDCEIPAMQRITLLALLP